MILITRYYFFLNLFSVMPIYYVMFTTATITASVILFQGFNTTSTVNVVSLFCGFGTIFSGVLLLNNAQHPVVEPSGHAKSGSAITTGRSTANGDHTHGYAERRTSRESTLLNAFDEESLGLTQLREEEDDDTEEEEGIHHHQSNNAFGSFAEDDLLAEEEEGRRRRMMSNSGRH